MTQGYENNISCLKQGGKMSKFCLKQGQVLKALVSSPTSNDRFRFKWSVQSSVQCIDIYIYTEAQATFNILFRVIWIFYSHFLILCNLLFKHKQHPFEGSNIKGLNLQEKENKIYNQKHYCPVTTKLLRMIKILPPVKQREWWHQKMF